jgi:protein SCO1/2
MRGIGAAIAVLLTGSAVLWQATDGLQALTTESARRLAVERAPRTLHDPLLQDQFGRGFRLSDYRGRRLLVQFIFTRCATLCLALGDDFARIAQALPPDRLGRDVSLVSISFDPAHDGVEQLADYAARFGADGEGWRMARIADAAELPRLLDDFGVVVIPDPDFGFQHNAAQHLVDPAGRLARIFDYGDPQAGLRALEP